MVDLVNVGLKLEQACKFILGRQKGNKKVSLQISHAHSMQICQVVREIKCEKMCKLMDVLDLTILSFLYAV